MTSYLFIAAGLALLFGGGELLVRQAASLGVRLGVTPLLVGLTVVAYGTSTPELVVSVRAALADSADIALGNVVGSNIANVALILGIAALIRPLSVKAQLLRVDVPLMVAVSLLLLLLLWDGQLSRLEGGLLVAGVAAYTLLAIALARRERSAEVRSEFAQAVPPARFPVWGQILLIVVGLGLLMVGADWLVRGAVTLAQGWGVSEAVVGLTIVAVGTSLPELATSVVAAVRRQGDIAIGNVVGSNIYNILGILGVAALLQPLQASGVQAADLWIMLGVAAVCLPLMRTGFVISRAEGALLVAGYAAYVIYLAQRSG
jgi:cation:H+ antiporter